MKAQARLENYYQHLSETPAPGGNGCHPALLGNANRAVWAGLTPERIYSDIRNAIPPGSRKVPDREIIAAINKAFADKKQTFTLPDGKMHYRYKRRNNKPAICDGKIALQKIINQGTVTDEADLCDLSPVRLSDAPERDTTIFLNTLYEPHEYIWIGERYDQGVMGKNIMTVADWLKLISSTQRTAPFFIINPLTGKPADKISGDGQTYRGENNVISFKYALVEFDTLTHEEQIRFWSAVKLPIRSLVDTGGKSIHALIDVQKLFKVETIDHWNTQIKNDLYDRFLSPLGVDKACSNAARLSRLPGHLRAETQKFQRILWLSPEGRPVCQ